ncbi:MAG: thiol-disulfide oxidoreductase DCC family protein [Planctomycetaceae bacterium]
MTTFSTASVPCSPASELPVEAIDRPIVFFDGVCGLCNSSVNWIISRDRAAVFRFSPLQGETAAARLLQTDIENLNSMVLQLHGRCFRKSSAFVRILWQLGPLEKLAGGLLWLIPKPLRDLGYGIVARNRYRWFGKKETCRLPTPQERARFLP